jgi:mono/diheme cytochrome c family protein
MNSEPKNFPVNREAEPSVGFAPVPVVLFLVLGALFFAGQLYLDKFAGGFNAKVYQPYDSWKMVQDLQPKGAGDILAAKGKKIYDTACVACHQASGLGAAGIAPPLAGSEWVLAAGPNRMLRVIHSGLMGPITVKGVPFNLAMPGMGRDLNLSAEDLAAVATYIRGNKDWGNNASAVTPEQAKAVLDQIKDRQTQWTAEELSAVPEQ